jgi:hypothetical protein
MTCARKKPTCARFNPKKDIEVKYFWNAKHEGKTLISFAPVESRIYKKSQKVSDLCEGKPDQLRGITRHVRGLTLKYT